MVEQVSLREEELAEAQDELSQLREEVEAYQRHLEGTEDEFASTVFFGQFSDPGSILENLPVKFDREPRTGLVRINDRLLNGIGEIARDLGPFLIYLSSTGCGEYNPHPGQTPQIGLESVSVLGGERIDESILQLNYTVKHRSPENDEVSQSCPVIAVFKHGALRRVWFVDDEDTYLLRITKMHRDRGYNDGIPAYPKFDRMSFTPLEQAILLNSMPEVGVLSFAVGTNGTVEAAGFSRLSGPVTIEICRDGDPLEDTTDCSLVGPALFSKFVPVKEGIWQCAFHSLRPGTYFLRIKIDNQRDELHSIPIVIPGSSEQHLLH
ncbi:MAG: hypothetical protein WHU10_06430 [Fimbriimonadales bacterium]